jgi:putative SOS response-associated peptidase YedK
MPVILAAESWPGWLDERAPGPTEAESLLVPYPADDMVIWPVDRRVGNVKNKGPSLIEPARASSRAPAEGRCGESLRFWGSRSHV